MVVLYSGQTRRGRSLVFIFLLLACFILQMLPVSAQARATATPVSAVLVAPTPEGLERSEPTLAPTLSPTPLPATRLRALSSAGNINVRALPDLESEILGTIADDSEHQVLRNYFRWYELSYDLSPNGRAWVYGDLVEILGDRSLIIVIENPDEIELVGQVQNLPGDGGEEAEARTIAISTIQADSAQSVELVAVTALPTFTRPAPTPASFTNQLETEASRSTPWADFPPLLPIAVLGSLGVLGFLISALRR